MTLEWSPHKRTDFTRSYLFTIVIPSVLRKTLVVPYGGKDSSFVVLPLSVVVPMLVLSPFTPAAVVVVVPLI